MILESLLYDPPTYFCKMYEKASPIGRILYSLHQPAVFQSVDGSRHGAAGQQNFFADPVNGHWPFVEQRLHDAKIGQI